MKYVLSLLLAFAWVAVVDAQKENPGGNLEGRVGRLEGIVEQIDKRLTNIEQDQRETLKRMDALRSDMNTIFLQLVGLMFTLFLGNVGLHWYWNRKSGPSEVGISRSAENPVLSPAVERSHQAVE